MSDEQNVEEQKQDESVQSGDPVEALKKEMEEYKLGWQRAVADYQNLQKETRERRAEWISMSEQQIVEEFIPVYDNFKKAMASMTMADDSDKRLKSLQQGIGYIMKQFNDVLKAHKVEEIKTVGEMFDARFHETVGEEESDKKSGTIIKEVDGGYMMGGRVIKVAKVIVAQ